MTKIQHDPAPPQDPHSLKFCPGNSRTIKEIADQLRRDLDAAVPFSMVDCGAHFTFLPPNAPGGVWRKTSLLSYNAVNTQTEAHCLARPFDLVVPVTRYAERSEASGRAFLTVSGHKIPGVPS